MGVLFRAADDVAELLIPFVRNRGGVEDAGAIRVGLRRCQPRRDHRRCVLAESRFATVAGRRLSVRSRANARRARISDARQATAACRCGFCPTMSNAGRGSCATAFAIDAWLSGSVISSDAAHASRMPRFTVTSCAEAVTPPSQDALRGRSGEERRRGRPAANPFVAVRRRLRDSPTLTDQLRGADDPGVTLQPFTSAHIDDAGTMAATTARCAVVSGARRESGVGRESAGRWIPAHHRARCGRVGYIRWQYVDRETLDSLGLRDIPENSVDADILIGERGDVGKGTGPLALTCAGGRTASRPARGADRPHHFGRQRACAPRLRDERDFEFHGNTIRTASASVI